MTTYNNSNIGTQHMCFSISNYFPYQVALGVWAVRRHSKKGRKMVASLKSPKKKTTYHHFLFSPSSSSSSSLSSLSSTYRHRPSHALPVQQFLCTAMQCSPRSRNRQKICQTSKQCFVPKWNAHNIMKLSLSFCALNNKLWLSILIHTIQHHQQFNL